MFKTIYLYLILFCLNSIHSKCANNSFDCGNNICIPRKWRCDKEEDCPNISDEQSCYAIQRKGKPIECSLNHSLCDDNKKCIPNIWICDGEYDCPHGSDETYCPKHCNGFLCKNLKCIPLISKCDGTYDCSDSSDETDCFQPKNKSCESDHHFYRCLSGECIPRNKVCDNILDCPQSDDESYDCLSINCQTKNCSQKCFLSNIGPKCYCSKGFILDRDNITCVDGSNLSKLEVLSNSKSIKMGYSLGMRSLLFIVFYRFLIP